MILPLDGKFDFEFVFGDLGLGLFLGV